MSNNDAGYDYHRYRKMLAEAVDDTRRLELIDLLIKEKARDRLEAQRTSDRVANGVTPCTVPMVGIMRTGSSTLKSRLRSA